MRTLALAPMAVVVVAGCDDPILRRQICDPGTVICQPDGTSQVCSPAGTTWQPAACPVGQICVTQTCQGTHVWTDGCRDIVCGPACDPTENSRCTTGTRRCNPEDNVRIEECDETGTDWCCVGSCARPELDGVCYQGECRTVCDVGEKSYQGCDYFAVDLDNAYVRCGNEGGYCDAAGAQFAVVLSNPNTQREVVYKVTNGPNPQVPSEDLCEMPEHLVAAGVLPPKGLAIVELPRRDVNGTMKGVKAYRISSNEKITAYQFNPLENVDVFSNDASLLLPTNTAGNRYFVMTREQTFDDLKGYVTVVGVTEEIATVTVTVTAPTLAGPGIPAMLSGDSFTTTLERFEVLNIETNYIGGDLTGSLVISDQPVVVFGGSEAANAPNNNRCDLETLTCEWDGETPCACLPEDGDNCSPHAKCASFNTCCADHLEQQLFPLSTWGTEYVAVRSMPRGTAEFPGQEKDVWRILAAQDGTAVELVPPVAQVPVLDSGEWFEFESGDDFLVVASHPVLVGQFLAAEQAPGPGEQDGDAKTGDPAFILAVPTRQFRDSYVFLAPNKYAHDYVSIAVRAGASVRLDGQEVEQLDPDVAELQVRDIAGTPWRALRARIADGFHVISCPTTCSVMVHGYDQYVSYGYPGGLNLEDDGP